MRYFSHLLLWVSVVLLAATGAAAAGPEKRFFLMGSGELHLVNLRNSREARVHLLDQNGAISETALTAVDRLFGFPTEEKGEHISPRLLFMLSYFSDLAAPGKTIHIESAYRSPEYNDRIRKQGANAARTSTHIDGMALDFWIEGVAGKALWETIRQKNCCGVGHYGDKTIHLDAGRPRFWEATTSGTKSAEPDYNRHLYLSTGYDRYAPGEELRLSLSGISTFDFGIRTTVKLRSAADPKAVAALIAIHSLARTECLRIDDRKASRFLSARLPDPLPAGRYRIELEFCQKPFPQMPDAALSNEIEIVP